VVDHTVTGFGAQHSKELPATAIVTNAARNRMDFMRPFYRRTLIVSLSADANRWR
jgi:hypothetical protein